MIIHHMDCGMLTCTEEEVRARLEQLTGTATLALVHVQAFRDVEANVRQQLQKVISLTGFPHRFPVREFIDDMTTGRLHGVAT